MENINLNLYQQVGADIKLGSDCGKTENKNFEKLQELLASAQSIQLYDANGDGKFNDREHLVVKDKDGNTTLIFNPKRGDKAGDIQSHLSSEYVLGSNITDVNFRDFVVVKAQSKTEMAAEAKKQKQIKARNEGYIRNIGARLNGNGKTQSYEVKIEGDMAIITFRKPKGWFSRNASMELGEMKEKLQIADGVIGAHNDLSRGGPYLRNDADGRSNYDMAYLQDGQSIRIPVSEIGNK